jgi:hypothetical protein
MGLTHAQKQARMNLRSGRDRFDAVFTCVNSDWPTIKHGNMLAIKTVNMDEFVRHCKWLMDKGFGDNKISARLSALAITESIRQCPELRPRLWKFMVTVRNKLRDVDNKPAFLERYIRDFSNMMVEV